MNEPMGVSIIVVNYNNERFLAAAIESALGQNHPLCEIIVVDDCSTDNSRAIIARYGDRIRSVLREVNGGQTAALNSAWPLAHYPILIFLDSDDLLLPHAAATFASRWSGEMVKIQGPLVMIDKAGRQLGQVAPKFPPNLDTAMIRRAMLRTGCAPLSNGSGSAFSRALMQSITRDGGFDLENLREMWMEWILECNAPFYGEVLTIYEPQGCYRIHDSNLYHINSIDPTRFAAECRSFAIKLDYFTGRCRKWGIPFDPAVARNSSLWPLECRLLADKLSCTKDSLVEPVWCTLFRALKSCINNEIPVSNPVIHAAWLVGVAVSPRAVALRLIEFRFLAAKRPAWLQTVLTTIANITAWGRSSRTEAMYR
jgi:glycosyltransferase involved in cell wall biosynthesis